MVSTIVLDKISYFGGLFVRFCVIVLTTYVVIASAVKHNARKRWIDDDTQDD